MRRGGDESFIIKRGVNKNRREREREGERERERERERASFKYIIKTERLGFVMEHEFM